MATRVGFEPGWRRHIKGDVHDLVERGDAETATDAKAARPVRTRRLRNGTEHEMDSGTRGIGNDVPYAGNVEERTRYLAAEPFFRPTLLGVRSL